MEIKDWPEKFNWTNGSRSRAEFNGQEYILYNTRNNERLTYTFTKEFIITNIKDVLACTDFEQQTKQYIWNTQLKELLNGT